MILEILLYLFPFLFDNNICAHLYTVVEPLILL